jgi:hypothetical protein
MLLKFGQIKQWNPKEDFNEKDAKVLDLLYTAHRMFKNFSPSLILSKFTPKSVLAIIEIIKLLKDDATIQNDWDNNFYTKAQAIEYVKNYRKTEELEKDKTWPEIEEEIRNGWNTDESDLEPSIKAWKDVYDWFEETYKYDA